MHINKRRGKENPKYTGALVSDGITARKYKVKALSKNTRKSNDLKRSCLLTDICFYSFGELAST
jgi:hypothetical protein